MKNYIIEALNKDIQSLLENLFDNVLKVDSKFDEFLQDKNQLKFIDLDDNLGIKALIDIPFEDSPQLENWQYLRFDNLNRRKKHISRNIEYQMNKLGIIHLYIFGYREEDLRNFKVMVNKNV